MNDSRRGTKVAVVGMGAVGAAFAYAATIKGLTHTLALTNRTPERAEGEAMDLRHGLPFAYPMQIEAGGYEHCEGADIVIMAAGASQGANETRLDLAGKNAEITKKLVGEVLKRNPDPILFFVANPVDVLTYVGLKESGLPKNQVFGSGTSLDSSRFRFLLSHHCGLDPRNIHAHVVGEHGDSEVALWSRVNVAGVALDEYCPVCGRGCDVKAKQRIFEDVRDAAYHVIEKKGETSYAIGLAMTSIVETVLKNQHSVHTVSTLMEGEYGIKDVCLSLPCVLGRGGVQKVISTSLAGEEKKALQHSASVLRETLDSIGC
ncbi:MAG: L-lactate dehydrogenase [Desulfovibrionaceae bacterium]